MTGWLLDTDVLSAFAPGRAAIGAEAARWFERHTDELFLSAITVAEIEAGIAKLRRMGVLSRAGELRQWFGRVLDLYAERVLPFDREAAQIAGPMGDEAAAAGRHPGFADVAIAAIAKSRDLGVLTPNLRHFAVLGISVLDPFKPV